MRIQRTIVAAMVGRPTTKACMNAAAISVALVAVKLPADISQNVFLLVPLSFPSFALLVSIVFSFLSSFSFSVLLSLPFGWNRREGGARRKFRQTKRGQWKRTPGTKILRTRLFWLRTPPRPRTRVRGDTCYTMSRPCKRQQRSL